MRVIALVFASLCLTVFGGSIAAAKEVSNQEVSATVDLVLKENGLTQEAATRMLPGAEYTIFGHKETVRKSFYVWNGVKKYLKSAPSKPAAVVRAEVPRRIEAKPEPKKEILGTGKSYLEGLAKSQEVERKKLYDRRRAGAILLIVVALFVVGAVAEGFIRTRRRKYPVYPDYTPNPPEDTRKTLYKAGSYKFPDPKGNPVPKGPVDPAAKTKNPESIHEAMV